MNKFAERLRELRESVVMTQKQLGKAAGISERTVSYLESGKRECCFDVLIKLADCFDVSVDYLLGRRDFD